MHIVDLIAKKRDGKALDKEEIEFIIKGYTSGKIPDYQISALLMAIYFQNMNDEESTFLALAMRESGDSIDLSEIPGIKVDKHSTGGVGDKVTLVLGPLLASLGVKFAKMSGRGLGHTGGTIDKLESIPGFKVVLEVEDFIAQVKKIGIAIVGQSGDVAPADKKLYALRDVTATVDVIPLIASSIMSKKLASGADAIVLDVKVGHGAFMKTEEDAVKLAHLMVEIGRLAGKKMTAILTGMDEPLGHKIGNALEVYEAIETLNGQGPKDLVDVTIEIGAHLLLDAQIETDFDIAKMRLQAALQNGTAYEKFLELVEAQGGNLKSLDNPGLLLSKKTVEVLSEKEGYIMDIDALDIGKAAMRLGAGRETKEDEVFLDVGLDLHKKIGSYVKKGDVIATLYVRDKGIIEAKQLILNALTFGAEKRKIVLIKQTIK
ncbi:MAG: pyrimidine-nucleoside phosphorylase [Firmicutes bacterium]|nr:pyrimidine-nucleoside phosphorylase [Bacillota bacterium]